MRIFEIDVGALHDDELGMDAISLVRNPAIKRKFLHFADELQLVPILDDEKHVVTGPVCIPDQPIYRWDENMGEFAVVFTREAIDQMVLKYMSRNQANNVDVEHSGDLVEDVTLIELYQIDHVRGIVPVEYSDLPDGTLIASFKVNNLEVWQQVVDGEITGFSLSCVAELTNPVEVPEENLWDFDLIFSDMNKHKSLLFRAAKFLLSFSEIKTKDGLVFNLEGDVPAEGMAILDQDGKPLDGTFELEDGCTIECAAGQVTKVIPAAAPEEPVEEATEPEPSAAPEPEEKPAGDATEVPLEEEKPADETPEPEVPEAPEAPAEEQPAAATETEEPIAEAEVAAEEQPAEEDPLKQANEQIAELKARNAELIAENEDLRKQIAEKDVQNIENGSLQFTSHRKPGDQSGKDVFSSMLDYMASK